MELKPIVNQSSLNLNLQSLSRLDDKGSFSVKIQPSRKGSEGKDFFSPEKIEEILKELKEKFNFLNTQLKVEIDKETDTIVVKVIDTKTNKVVRQIPPEYVLKIARYLNEIAGLLYSKKA
ncbi:flagellar protein FlaG [Thermovibrio sp.]